MNKRTLIGKYKADGSNSDVMVWLHLIPSMDEFCPFLAGLVECYKKVFGGAPYFENYDGQENTFIIPSFVKFAEQGILVLLVAETTENKVIGFGAGISADKSEVAEFLEENANRLEIALDGYLYMAELGVLPEFRHQGLGRLLVRARIEAAMDETNIGLRSLSRLIMRTASIGSNSAKIYASLGAAQVGGLIQVKTEFGTQSPERIFLSMPLLNQASRAVS